VPVGKPGRDRALPRVPHRGAELGAGVLESLGPADIHSLSLDVAPRRSRLLSPLPSRVIIPTGDRSARARCADYRPSAALRLARRTTAPLAPAGKYETRCFSTRRNSQLNGIRAAFCLLCREHNKWPFATVVLPPFECGCTWSACSFAVSLHRPNSKPCRSHRAPARERAA